MSTVITGTGHYIPEYIRSNDDFSFHEFYNERHQPIASPTGIIEKFEQITGIYARRYACTDMNASDMAARAAANSVLKALTSFAPGEALPARGSSSSFALLMPVPSAAPITAIEISR